MTAPVYEPAELKAGARARILDAYRSYIAQIEQLGGHGSYGAFVDRYNRGQIEVPQWVRSAIPTLHKMSLFNWLKRHRTGGDAALQSDYRPHRLGTGKIDSDPALRAAILAHLAQHPRDGAGAVQAALSAAHPQIRQISERRLRAWMSAHRR